MTKEELASALNGRQYTSEISDREEQMAKESGLLVLFGASDDLCELRGAINDELSAYNGCTLLIGPDGNLLQEIDRDDEEVLKRHGLFVALAERRKSAIKIDCKWCATKEYSWTFETESPHAAFDVLEDDDKFCRGIVIDLKEAARQLTGRRETEREVTLRLGDR